MEKREGLYKPTVYRTGANHTVKFYNFRIMIVRAAVFLRNFGTYFVARFPQCPDFDSRAFWPTRE